MRTVEGSCWDGRETQKSKDLALPTYLEKLNDLLYLNVNLHMAW